MRSDPERAVRAALDILRAISVYAAELRARGMPDIQMRIGLNTGLVVVGNIGSDMHVEYLAIGDTVNLAARMQSAAQPDSVLISASTQKLVRHLFELDYTGALTVKGKANRCLHIALARGPWPARRGIEGLGSPLIGRDREIAVLRTRIQDLLDGRGAIISVMGEAGLGKSRLISETLLRAPVQFERHEGRCLSYTLQAPFAPFIDMLSRLFDLAAVPDEAMRYARIGDPYLATLLGAPLPDALADKVRFYLPLLREMIFGSLIALIEKHCADGR